MTAQTFFGVVTNLKDHITREFIGFEVTLDDKHIFRFPCFPDRNELKVGRRVFMDFSALQYEEVRTVLIHIFKGDDEMKQECDGTVFMQDICYVKSYLLLKEFIPWAT